MLSQFFPLALAEVNRLCATRGHTLQKSNDSLAMKLRVWLNPADGKLAQLGVVRACNDEHEAASRQMECLTLAMSASRVETVVRFSLIYSLVANITSSTSLKTNADISAAVHLLALSAS